MLTEVNELIKCVQSILVEDILRKII